MSYAAGSGARGGIGSSHNNRPSAASSSSTSAAAASSSTSRHHERTTAEIHAAIDADPQDYISASLEDEFEGGEWINGEFYVTGPKKKKRYQTKEEQIYGYDDEAEQEYYAAEATKRKTKIAGGIAFVLGSTLQPEQNAAQQREKAAAAEAKLKEQAAAAAKNATLEGPIPMDEDEEIDDRPSFQQLRQAKASSTAVAASSSSSRATRQRERDEAEEAERAMAGRGGGGLGFGSSSSVAATPAPSSSSYKPVSKPPPAKVDKDFAAFTKHGTGFGLKMLAKSGFRPGDRLGKHGTGVVNPIVAKLRPNSMGLGFGNFKEVDKSNMARNAMEEEQMEKEKEEEKKKKKEEHEVKMKEGWKKDSKKGGAAPTKVKRIYKTAAEVLANDTQQVGGVTPLVIMDYRGPTAKVTSLDQVSSTIEHVSTGADAPAPQMLPELQHNLRTLVSMAEDDLRRLEHERQTSSTRLQQLRQELVHLESSTDYDETPIHTLGRMMKQVEESANKLKAISKSTPNSLTRRLELVINLLHTLHTSYPREYIRYDIPGKSLPLYYPLIKGLLFNWEPFTTESSLAEETKHNDVVSIPTKLPVLKYLAQFKPLLAPTASTGSERNRVASNPLYQRVLAELFLPKLQEELSHATIQSPQPIVQLLRSIAPICTDEIYALVKDDLFKRLKHEIKQWNPRTHPEPIHEWVFPYTDFIRADQLAKLYDDIRSKLSLKEWSLVPKSGPTALQVIGPWATRFQSEQFENLLQRAILPKLKQLLQTQFTLQPGQLDSTTFVTFSSWMNLIVVLPPSASPTSSINQIRTILIRDFFTKWFQALFIWLNSKDVDFEAVGDWYAAWKKLFPSLLLVDATIKSCFSKGLDLMNQAVSEQPIQVVYDKIVTWLQAPSTIAPPTAASSIPASMSSIKTAPTASPSSSSFISISLDGGGSDAAFIEQIGTLAADRDIEFWPHLVGAGTVHGKQIYHFGPTIQIYCDRGAIYRKGENHTGWILTSLPELFQLEQTKSSTPTAAAPVNNNDSSRHSPTKPSSSFTTRPTESSGSHRSSSISNGPTDMQVDELD